MKYSSDFYRYLEDEKRCAETTMRAYTADVDEFCDFLSKRGKSEEHAGNADVAAYLMELKSASRSGSTINRKLASLRCYYGFLKENGKIRTDPTSGIKSPKVKRAEIEYLSIEEVERLLAAPDDSDKGIRDRAMIELMYATGIRASEAARADIADINFQIGFISVKNEQGSVRMIPIGRPARKALEEYIEGPRKKFIGKKEDSGALLVNFFGERISRQGIWKILKHYGEEAGLEGRISPKVLRNSFAAHMVQNGADIKSLQEILGHDDINATKFLLSLTKNRIMDVYDMAFPRA